MFVFQRRLVFFLGPPILCDGLDTIVKAEYAIVNAKNEVKECMSQVWKHTKNIKDYRSRISKTQNEIERTNQTLSNVQSNIEWLQQRLVVMGEIQHNFRTAVFHMNILSGRVNVLQSDTGSCIYWEPVIKTIQEVGNAVITIANNQLLNCQNVPALVNTLSKNIRGLKALCTTPDHSEYVGYYWKISIYFYNKHFHITNHITPFHFAQLTYITSVYFIFTLHSNSNNKHLFCSIYYLNTFVSCQISFLSLSYFL